MFFYAPISTQCHLRYRHLLVVCLFMASSTLAQSPPETSPTSDFLLDMQKQQHNALLNAQQYKAQAQQLAKQAMKPIQSTNKAQRPSGVMAFASLGMPKTSLEQLLTQAAQLNIPVVIRGLWQNDFKTTATKIQSLISPKDGNSAPIMGGMEINPVWFKQFGIQRVPAFVAVKEGACLDEPPCDPTDFDIVYGNVSLYDALDTLRREGQYPEIARKYQP